ncbi:MAG: response regulator [Patescibacteria group bacterium]|jgi:CheY-like chemotaxis protein
MPKTILIIEDEESILDMYRLRFERDGYRVLTATRGKAGIAIAKAEKPDLILLDVVMPEMDGFDVLRQLKGAPATKNLRVIFLSNLGQPEEIKEGMKLGVEDYIIKANLTPTLLVKRIEEKLGVKPASNGSTVTSKSQPVKTNGESVDQPLCAGLRVLLIEDNKGIIEMYKMRLEKEGATVTVAENGAWGLKQAKAGQFDVVLMDMVMPALHGLEAIKTLKKNPATAKMPIFVFSNSAQEDDIRAAKQAGAEKYLIKSNITPATLIQEIKKYTRI